MIKAVLTASFILCCISSSFAGWSPLGPYGGVITSIIVVKGGIYAGTEGGGVFFSKDGGRSWDEREKGLENLFVESLAVSNEGILYAGTRDGVFRSMDGKTWDILHSVPRGSAVKNMVFDQEGNLRLSLWGSGIFICRKDTDCINPRKELSSLFVNTILPENNGDIVVATEGGVFRKHREEEKWLQDGLIEYMVLSIALDNRGVLYAATWGGGAHFLDKGDWHFRSMGLGSSMMAVLAGGPDGNLYAGTEGGLSILSQNSDRWSSAGLDKVYIKAIGFGKNGEVYAGSHGKGFFAKEKGMGWEERNRGIYNSNIISIAVSRNGTLFAGTKQGLYIGQMGDANWLEVPDLYGMNVNYILIDGGYAYAGTSNGLFIGNASGAGWRRVEGEIGFMPVTALAKAGSFIYAGTDSDGVFRGTAEKGEWTSASNGLENMRVRSLLADKAGDVHAATYGGVYVLRKESRRWEKEGLQDSVIISLASHEGSLFAAAESSGVFVGKEGKWSPLNGTLPNKRIISLFHSGKGLYAGGYGWIVYREGDGPWKDVAGAVSNTTIQTVASDKDGHIYIGTWGSGIWKME